MAHQSSAQQPEVTNRPRPQRKLLPAGLQRSPMASNHNAPKCSSQNVDKLPGPIRATVAQVGLDENGVRLIAFGYKRKQINSTYIRCDVESVNTDSLPQDFRNENCLYPKACCAKDSYKGHRFGYENGCNTVG